MLCECDCVVETVCGVRFGVLVWYRPPGMISDRKRKLIEQYTVSKPRNSKQRKSNSRNSRASRIERIYGSEPARPPTQHSQDRAHGAGFSSGSCLLFVRAEQSRRDRGRHDSDGQALRPYRFLTYALYLGTLGRKRSEQNNKTRRAIANTQIVRPLPAL